MGGLHSGRMRRHTCIDDCIVLDLAYLKKQKMLAPGQYHLQSNKWTMTNYSEMKTHSYKLQIYVVSPGQVTLAYQTSRPGTDQVNNHTHTIQLTSTSCNYGGSRAWFVSPCCGSRVRVLYINPKCGELESITPQCRQCLDLHYESQMSSYREKHITYEKHLLANYGYFYAEHKYQVMKGKGELYFEVTSEYREKKARSQLEMQRRFIKQLMSFNRFMLRTHTRTFRTIKSTEDRCMYLDDMLQEWGTRHALSILAGAKGHHYATSEEIQALTASITGRPVQKDKSDYTKDVQALYLLKEQIEEELDQLDKAA